MSAPDPKHRNALLTLFKEASKQGSCEGRAEDLQAALAHCRALIEVGGPITDIPTSPAALFISRLNWKDEPVLQALFKDYVAAGLIGPNTLLMASGGKWPNGILPLELAILLGSVDAIEAFLNAGADPGMVPSKEWVASGAQSLSAAPLTNIYEFIEAKTMVAQRVGQMKAVVAAALIRRRLDSLVEMTAHSTAALQLPGRRRSSL